MSARYEVKPEGKGKDKQWCIWDNAQGKVIYRGASESRTKALGEIMNLGATDGDS